MAAIGAFAGALWVSDARTVSNIGLMLPPAVAAVACLLRRLHTPPGRMQLAWSLLGAGCASWCVGQITWSWLESVRGDDVPFPSGADVGYLAAVPMLAAGLMALPTASSRAVGLARTVIDGLVIAASVLLVSWVVVLDRVADVDDDTLARTIALAYPATDVVIITIALFALSRARRARGLDVRTLGLLVVGLVGFAVADSGFAYLTASDQYTSGNVIDLGWFTCFLLVALAASRPPGPDHDPDAAGSSATYPLLPAVPVLVAAVLLAVNVARGAHDEVAELTGALLLVLVVLRGTAFARENRALTRDLEARVAERTGELMRSEETLRMLIEGAADHAIFLVDQDGRIASWNAGAQRLFGFEPEQVVGRPVDVLSEKSLDVGALLEEVRSVGVLELEGPHRRAAAEPFDATVAMTATYGPGSGRPFEGAVVIVRDVTAQRAAVAQAEALAQQLRQRQRLEAVGQLAGGVAHDFNNLLTVISGTVELLPGAVAAGEPIEADVAAIGEAAARAAALTRQLLTFSRRGAVDVEVLDVGDVIAGVEELLRRSLGGHVGLVVAPSDDAHCVVADRSQLEQVLVNLAVNARDAMPRGGTVTVSLASVDAAEAGLDPTLAPEGVVCLSVEDDGEGMPEEVQARAFEPFFTTKPTGRGTGLGLATVYGIVTGLGGVVRIDSEVGRGTAVRCYLPASTSAAASAAGASGPGETDGRQRTVLVVEDEAAVRMLTERLLTRAGFRVLTAPDGASAVRVVDAEPHLDLVLTDVVMPGMNGRELGALVRSTRPSTRLLFMSGHTAGLLDDDDLDGEAGVLAKPFSSEALLRAVGAAMEAPAGAADEGPPVSDRPGARPPEGALPPPAR